MMTEVEASDNPLTQGPPQPTSPSPSHSPSQPPLSSSSSSTTSSTTTDPPNTSPPKSAITSTINTTTTTTTTSTTSTTTSSQQQQNTTGVKEPVWAADNSTDKCNQCSSTFTFLNRKHHCRRCGQIFCGDCTAMKITLQEGFGAKGRVRVCAKCGVRTLKERVRMPLYVTPATGGPGSETVFVSAGSRLLYWKVGARDGATFDRSIVDTVESSGTVAIPVASVQDLVVETLDKQGTFRVRCYTPNKTQSKIAALLWYHTGHFALRSIESASVDALCRLLCNQIPCVVISVDYRLAPENKFPCAVEDCFGALCWAAVNAAKLNIDTKKMAVGGDGAGGNLAASVALIVRERGLPNGAVLCAQALVTPPMDLTPQADERYPSRRTFQDAYMTSLAQLHWFFKSYLGPAEGANPFASPLFAAELKSLPSTVVISAGHDPLRDEAEAYAKRLADNDVPVILTRYTNSAHAFFGSGLDESDEAVMEVAMFLADCFARQGSPIAAPK